MHGSVCICGFKTISIEELICPRCGRKLTVTDFADSGKVLSFVKLGVPPEGTLIPMNLAMVEIVEGPKIVCWTKSQLPIGQYVNVFSENSLLRCEPN